MNGQDALQRIAPLARIAAPFLEKKAAGTLADYLNRRRFSPDGELIPAEEPSQPGALWAIAAAGLLGLALGISGGIWWVKNVGGDR